MQKNKKNNWVKDSLINKRLCYQLVSLLFILGTAFNHLFAQAPTDEWRRGGLDAMVAEPGQASSILSNPAGIKTKEERHSIFESKENAGKKHEWITEVIAADFFLTGETWDLLIDPTTGIRKISSRFGDLADLSRLLRGQQVRSTGVVKTLQEITTPTYKTLVEGTGLPTDPTQLTSSDLAKMAQVDKDQLAKNLLDVDGLSSSLANAFTKKSLDILGNLGLEHYSRIFSLSHVNDRKPLAWGFYFGFEQKVLVRTNLESANMPLNLKIRNPNINRDIKLKVNVPIALQAYLVTPIRVAFAHDFGEALPGFTFGLGLKFNPYLGMNQESLGSIFSQIIESQTASSGKFDSQEMLSNVFGSTAGLNFGLDFGVQYHFGAILPQLEFLHAGLKISDLIGFNVPFPGNFNDGSWGEHQKVRYALDFDWGIYAEHQFHKIAQVFGGFEIIQLRGLFPGGQSPYSALLEPVDHLRFLVGIGLFDNVLRLTLQYYNSNFSPGIMLNLGAFQLQTAVNVNSSAEGSWGLEASIRFRSPHNGFNKRTPYKTYAQLATEKGRKNAQLEVRPESDTVQGAGESPEASEAQRKQ